MLVLRSKGKKTAQNLERDLTRLSLICRENFLYTKNKIKTN